MNITEETEHWSVSYLFKLQKTSQSFDVVVLEWIGNATWFKSCLCATLPSFPKLSPRGRYCFYGYPLEMQFSD